MSDPLSNMIGRLLPPETGDELRRNIDATIQSYLEKMNLATREQLEIQEKILRRTRERVAVLEERLRALEESSNPED